MDSDTGAPRGVENIIDRLLYLTALQSRQTQDLIELCERTQDKIDFLLTNYEHTDLSLEGTQTAPTLRLDSVHMEM